MRGIFTHLCSTFNLLPLPPHLMIITGSTTARFQVHMHASNVCFVDEEVCMLLVHTLFTRWALALYKIVPIL